VAKKEGVYYFSMHCLKWSQRAEGYFYLMIDKEIGCTTYSQQVDRTVQSCSIVRYLKTGQEVFVQRSATITEGTVSNPQTNFIGFLIST